MKRAVARHLSMKQNYVPSNNTQKFGNQIIPNSLFYILRSEFWDFKLTESGVNRPSVFLYTIKEI